MQDPVSAINIPDVDVWQLLFEQPKEFSRHKSTAKTLQLFSDPDLKLTTSQTFTSTMPPLPPTVSRMSSNKRSNLAVIWGTHYCGGTVFPMNPAYTAKELTRQLLLSKTKAICTQRNFLPTVREAALEAGVSQAMTLIGPDESAGTNSLHDMLTLDVAPVPRLPVTSPEQDLAFLVFLTRVVSAEGLDVPTGEQDELWLKGATVFSCYLNDPKSTSECFSADGFFMTGDIVVKDSDGYFNILDRIKELIKYKGFQVAPAELEGILMCHPLAADVCVIGVDDERQATQVPMACVVLQ
ncbi:hypothetical protein D6C98_05276 [Aureobasidium pullulans]|uniref:AMP-binding enzyme C-terminal domain-containing protein n=1 Tax=Aureobasidium pullulans TaxID=5580 RepID=A0A4S9ISV7_AURPU|nr:hypothetical protein D6D24_07450 [Aureobasidium pullulans]THX44270.1 hypothetical protein D6D11_07918 [Aureobasidium pullulans]THX70404.1 hypothetical protein D6D04_09926 [Aureobasidium pullulans]THX91836.1 hypothetical protein D6D03_10655 [Aureobasidium pullulans]THY52426.1 hypothetical protein D6C98_05276 [Aureobasidium pullulans]